jgi:hypothetical protein
MAIEFDPTKQWDRVASELRAFKQTQQQAWGDVDNATLGRYLADDLSPDERLHIEEALTQLPELRKLTDIVRDVLDEFDPAAPLPQLEAEPKQLLFPQPRSTVKPFSRILRQRGTLLVAAGLLLAFGLTLAGMQMFMPPKPNDSPILSSEDFTARKQDPWKGPPSQDFSSPRSHLLLATAKKPSQLEPVILRQPVEQYRGTATEDEVSLIHGDRSAAIYAPRSLSSHSGKCVSVHDFQL